MSNTTEARSLTTAQLSALHVATRRVTTAGPTHTPEAIAAQDALDALVASFVADARQAAVSEAALAVEMVGLADVRRLQLSAPGARMAS